jgi:hypothetical protein
MSSEIILAAVLLAVLIAACVFGFGLMRAVRDGSTTVQTVTVRCLEEIQSSNARVFLKMEEWHENEVRETRNHVERLLALQTVEPEDRGGIADTHAQERHHESELDKTHRHNTRMADLHERMAAIADATPPAPEKPPPRRPVERSSASKAREAINTGKIPTRH